MNAPSWSSSLLGMRRPYDLRPATNADYDFLYDLHAVTIKTSVDATWGWDDDAQQRLFRKRWNPAETQVAVVDDQDVGTLRLVENQDEVIINLIEIHPDYQNHGLGSTIIEDILTKAHQRSLPVLLHVLKTNEAAYRLYKRLGFEIIEEREERYVMRKVPSVLTICHSDDRREEESLSRAGEIPRR